MLWQFIIAGTKERFEVHKHPRPPQKYIRKLGGLSPIHSTRRHGAPGLMWGARGLFPPAAAMVVAVVMPVVFCAKATEKRNKNTKISCLLQKLIHTNILGACRNSILRVFFLFLARFSFQSSFFSKSRFGTRPLFLSFYKKKIGWPANQNFFW